MAHHRPLQYTRHCWNSLQAHTLQPRRLRLLSDKIISIYLKQIQLTKLLESVNVNVCLKSFDSENKKNPVDN